MEKSKKLPKKTLEIGTVVGDKAKYITALGGNGWLSKGKNARG